MTAEQKELVRMNVWFRLGALLPDMRPAYKGRIIRDVIRQAKARATA